MLASQRFFIHSCIYLRILIISYLATFLSPNSLSVLMCRKAVNQSIITPLTKKPGLVTTDARSYRLTLNLSVASQLLERLVAKQVIDYLQSNNLLPDPDQQSAYQSGFLNETATLLVLSDILQAVNEGDVAVLALFDLSAAFDHSILLQRLQSSYGFDGLALYLIGRTQAVVRLSTVCHAICHLQRSSRVSFRANPVYYVHT